MILPHHFKDVDVDDDRSEMSEECIHQCSEYGLCSTTLFPARLLLHARIVHTSVHLPSAARAYLSTHQPYHFLIIPIIPEFCELDFGAETLPQPQEVFVMWESVRISNEKPRQRLIIWWLKRSDKATKRVNSFHILIHTEINWSGILLSLRPS